MPSQKSQIGPFVCGLAIALLCGTAVLAQTAASDPTIQQAKDILLKGVASSNPDTRQQAVTAASLIRDHEQVVSKLSSMLETDKDVPEVDLAAALALYSLKQPEGKDFLLEVLGRKAKTSSGFTLCKVRFLLPDRNVCRGERVWL